MDTINPDKDRLNNLWWRKEEAAKKYHNASAGADKYEALQAYLHTANDYESLRMQMAVHSPLHEYHDKDAPIYAVNSDATDNDIVNNPSHYTQDGEIECIDAIRAALGEDGFRAFCRGNAMKYIWRSELKTGDPTTDLRKAEWYMNRAAKEAGA